MYALNVCIWFDTVCVILRSSQLIPWFWNITVCSHSPSRKRPGWTKFIMYIARTIIAPLQISQLSVSHLYNKWGVQLPTCTEVKFGWDDSSTPSIVELNDTVSVPVRLSKKNRTTWYTPNEQKDSAKSESLYHCLKVVGHLGWDFPKNSLDCVFEWTGRFLT